MPDGLNRQRSGDLTGAEAIYDAILQATPNDAMVRTLLGLVFCETSRFETGIQAIRDAITLADLAFSHFSLGQALAGRGRSAEAATAFRRSIELQPDILAGHIALGHALAAEADYAGAASAYSQAVRLDPNHPEPYVCAGTLLHRLGRPQDALAHLKRATELGAQRPDTWAALGAAYVALQQHDDAAAAFRRQIELAPDSAAAHLNLGDAFQSQRNHSAARLSYQRAIALSPRSADAHCHLSNTLYGLGLFEEAASSAEAALALAPDYADARSNLGNALLALQRYDAAEAAYRDAIRLQPGVAAFHSNLGTVLTAQRRVAEALEAQRRALTIDPGFVDARYNHAITLLLDGQLALGWQYYEARWELPGNPPRGFSQPLWTGEALCGRTILLHAEQGLGDMLHMARYVPLVAARGGRVVLEVHDPLVRLLQRMPGVQQVLPLGAPLPPFDMHCPLFSLPRLFDTIPAEPYIVAAPGRDRLRSGFRVGLVWGGGDRIGSRVNRDRSIALAKLAPLARVPGIGLYGLQKDAGLDSSEDPGIIDLMSGVVDFADTAAIIEQLDMIISVDTSTAHLAAAMGKPVWLLSRYSGCWRWLVAGMDSAWYPTMRIYRQERPGDWDTVIRQIASDLAKVVADTKPH